jgi:ribosomal protein L7/L12
VQFADFQPLPEGVGGHPRGLEWICEEHVEEARARKCMKAEMAIAAARANGAIHIHELILRRVDPGLWLLDVGKLHLKVLGIAREALACSASEVKAMLEQPPVLLARGWTDQLEDLRSRLVAAGAKVEVRFDEQG